MPDCQIDFYVLKTTNLDGRRLACRLALMAWEKGHQIQVLAEDAEAARQLDELLWTSPAERFVPHGISGTTEASAAPIEITTAGRLRQGGLVINLSRSAIEDPACFERLCEIVPQEKADRDASREKFRYYRGQGLAPQTHDIAR